MYRFSVVLLSLGIGTGTGGEDRVRYKSIYTSQRENKN